MTVSYSLNWMGPISVDWYRERGLTRKKTYAVSTEVKSKLKNLPIGATYELDEITVNYSAGRIDIRDDSKEGYDGWDEYSLPPMHGEDWNKLSDWLLDLTTTEQWDYEMLISIFEGECLGREIRWWKEQE